MARRLRGPERSAAFAVDESRSGPLPRPAGVCPWGQVGRVSTDVLNAQEFPL